jgi:hypothetical protein
VKKISKEIEKEEKQILKLKADRNEKEVVFNRKKQEF